MNFTSKQIALGTTLLLLSVQTANTLAAHPTQVACTSIDNIQEISPEDILSQEERSKYLLLDVRRDDEFHAGHIPNSLHIPLDQLEVRMHEINDYTEKEIICICRSGNRSGKATALLTKHGFSSVYNLKGGILQWTGPLSKQTETE